MTSFCHRLARPVLGLLLLAGCAGVADAAAVPAPRRESPPPAIEAAALAVGAPAPLGALSLAGSTGPFAPETVRGPLVAIFYRGHW